MDSGRIFTQGPDLQLKLMSMSKEKLVKKLLDPEEILNQSSLIDMLTDMSDLEILQVLQRLEPANLATYLLSQDCNMNTPLHTAARTNKHILVKKLLEQLDENTRSQLLHIKNRDCRSIMDLCANVRSRWKNVPAPTPISSRDKRKSSRQSSDRCVNLNTRLCLANSVITDHLHDCRTLTTPADFHPRFPLEKIVDRMKSEQVGLEVPHKAECKTSCPQTSQNTDTVVKPQHDQEMCKIKSFFKRIRLLLNLYCQSTIVEDLTEVRNNGNTLLHDFCSQARLNCLKKVLKAVKDIGQLIKLLSIENSAKLNCMQMLFTLNSSEPLKALIRRFSENLPQLWKMMVNRKVSDSGEMRPSVLGFALSLDNEDANRNIKVFLEEYYKLKKSSSNEGGYRFEELNSYLESSEFQEIELSRQQILMLNEFSPDYVIRHSAKTTTLAIIATNHFKDQLSPCGRDLQRYGSHEEADQVESTLKAIGCTVCRIDDWTKAKLLETIKNEILQNQGKMVCLMVCLMSHGHYGFMLDAQQETIDLSKILKEIDRAQGYFPKIMMCQCCQGISIGASNFTSFYDADPPENICMPTEQQPTAPHTCTMMSAAFGMSAMRGVFFDHMCQMIQNRREKMSLWEMFSQTCKAMINSNQGEPVCKSQLTGKVYLPHACLKQ